MKKISHKEMNRRQQKRTDDSSQTKIILFRTIPLFISVLFDVLVELMKKI